MSQRKNDVALFVALTLAAFLAGNVQAESITIPNAGFDTLYKPGSTTVTVTTLGGYSSGVGSNVGVVPNPTVFSDSTTGTQIDVPGWTSSGPGAGVQSFSDPSSLTGSNTPFIGVYVQGSDFGGNGSNDTVTSGALGLPMAGQIYTLTIQVGWRTDVSPVGTTPQLNLMEGSTVLTPDSALSPALVQGSFVTYSRTYSAATIEQNLGQQLSISFGLGANPTGQQVDFDSVTLTAVPEPASLALFGLGGVGLIVAAVGRRKA